MKYFIGGSSNFRKIGKILVQNMAKAERFTITYPTVFWLF